MDTITLDRFRHALTKHRETLLEWIEIDSNHKNIRLGGAPSNAVIQIICKHHYGFSVRNMMSCLLWRSA